MAKKSESGMVSIEEFKDAIREELFESLPEMFADIRTLNPKDRTDRRLKLMDFVVAKVQSVQANESGRVNSADELLAKEAEYLDGKDDDL